MRRGWCFIVALLALALPARAADVLRFEGDYQELSFKDGKRTARPMRVQIWDQEPRGATAVSGKAFIRLSNGEVYPVVSRFVGTRSAVYLGLRDRTSLVLHFGALPDAVGSAAMPVDAQMLTSSGGPPRPVHGTWHPPTRPPIHHGTSGGIP